MKKRKNLLVVLCIAILLVAVVVVLALVGTRKERQPQVKGTIVTDITTYYGMDDGTWQCNDISYQYRLEISGRMPNAAEDSTFVYLSNLENITFEQAWKAAGLSSSLADYFPVEDAVCVEIR